MDKLTREKAIFSKVNAGIALPPIFSYWSNRYLGEKLIAVAGAKISDEFYFNGFVPIDRTKLRVLSIGSGTAAVDLRLAKRLMSIGRLERYDCLELTPFRVEAANQDFEKAGLAAVMRCHECDAADWDGGEYDCFVATHSLHHIERLEQLFDMVFRSMPPWGRFATADMIGRNGHQRWPEALAIIERIWQTVPERYKRNHVFNRLDELYDDRDWSQNSNEGVRAQDILPLLMERFHFDRFVADGGVVEPFVDRVYGPNLSKDSPEDRLFVDQVAFLNDTLIDAGIITPTMAYAVMTKEPTAAPRFYRNWTPEHCVRRA